ncbi:MAG TPA: hypothetical protein VMC41_03915 [Candidatus Nanoarchaeia archaeon]|nr:hypothetical protein [Candidatus Nanoarchaeia archaeon]
MEKSKFQADFLIAVATSVLTGNEEIDKESGDDQAMIFYKSLHTGNRELLEVIGAATSIALDYNRPALEILLGEIGNYPIIKKYHNEGTTSDLARTLRDAIVWTSGKN